VVPLPLAMRLRRLPSMTLVAALLVGHGVDDGSTRVSWPSSTSHLWKSGATHFGEHVHDLSSGHLANLLTDREISSVILPAKLALQFGALLIDGLFTFRWRHEVAMPRHGRRSARIKPSRASYFSRGRRTLPARGDFADGERAPPRASPSSLVRITGEPSVCEIRRRSARRPADHGIAMRAFRWLQFFFSMLTHSSVIVDMQGGVSRRTTSLRKALLLDGAFDDFDGLSVPVPGQTAVPTAFAT